MKHFACRELKEALAYAEAGGQALYMHRRGEEIAHLFDRDRDRLVRTVRALGVRVIMIGREGRDGQHIDLCGNPLSRALALCQDALE